MDELVLATHFQLLVDDPQVGLRAGDVVACVSDEQAPGRLVACMRLSDGHQPHCTLDHDAVQLILGQTLLYRCGELSGWVTVASLEHG